MSGTLGTVVYIESLVNDIETGVRILPGDAVWRRGARSSEAAACPKNVAKGTFVIFSSVNSEIVLYTTMRRRRVSPRLEYATCQLR